MFKTSDFFKNVASLAEIAGRDITGLDITGHGPAPLSPDPGGENARAAERIARLRDSLTAHGYEGRALGAYLARLIFCLFAGDLGVFPRHGFAAYVENSKPDGSDLSERLSKLFGTLRLPIGATEKRPPLPDGPRPFGHVSLDVFTDPLPPANFGPSARRTLLDCASLDWAAISPAILGASLQGAMGRRLRRETGAHYTSEENILKVIRPLFLDGLWEEFGSLKADPEALARFREKISRLKFLDPACGSGDFLIITYRELRTLELEALKLPHPGSPPHFAPPPGPMVNAGQFSGIELDDFPCRIARLGMWLMDRQMDLRALAALPGLPPAPRPAPPGPNIAQGNALRMDWETVAPKKELSYVFGNPPFLGYSNQSPDQKADVLSVYRAPDGSPYPSAGKIDYVAAWYYKAAKFMEGTGIQAAFVSTSSIVQGEQVAFVWRPLLEDHGLKIDFARRPFKWASPARGKAAVRCVIVGFGRAGDGDNPRESPREKIIYDGDKKMPAQNINPYLVDGPNVFFASRPKAICPVPGMVYGNKPADGGFFFLDAKGREELLAREPGAQKYIKQVYGAREYINGIKRYCLWLIDADPSDLLKLPSVMERVEKVRLFRLASQKKQTRESASTPTLFQEIRQPASEYIIVPRHSSESRKYIPIGFVSPEILTNDAVFIIPGATLYHFAILTSIVHMAWVRATCGRIEVDYRYSKDVVYNNFPWPDPTASRREEISALAGTILEARALFPGSTLAALYDPQKTPPPLLEAHEKLDRAVMALYGLKPRKGQNEGAIVSGLTGLYQKLTGGH